MIAQRTQPQRTKPSMHEIAQALSEVIGCDCQVILDQVAATPSHDLAIPSPQAMVVLGKLQAKHGFRVDREDVSKTKDGAFCSMSLLADLLDRKLGESND